MAIAPRWMVATQGELRKLKLADLQEIATQAVGQNELVAPTKSGCIAQILSARNKGWDRGSSFGHLKPSFGRLKPYAANTISAAQANEFLRSLPMPGGA